MFCDVISVIIKNIQLNTDNKIESYVKKKNESQNYYEKFKAD